MKMSYLAQRMASWDLEHALWLNYWDEKEAWRELIKITKIVVRDKNEKEAASNDK